MRFMHLRLVHLTHALQHTTPCMLFWAASDSLLHLVLSVLYHLTACPDASLKNPQNHLFFCEDAGPERDGARIICLLCCYISFSIPFAHPLLNAPLWPRRKRMLFCWFFKQTASVLRESVHCHPVMRHDPTVGLNTAFRCVSLDGCMDPGLLACTFEAHTLFCLILLSCLNTHTPHLYQAQSGTVNQHQAHT